MKRNYSWFILAGLLLVALAVWFLPGRDAELGARLMGRAGPAVGNRSSPLLVSPTPSVPGDIAIELEPVARGLEHPTEVVFLPGELDVAVVLEQPGRVVWLTPGQEGPAKLWFSVQVDDTFTEKGLLGLAFHPKFRENGRLFLNYTVHEGKQDFSLVTEWKASDPSQPLKEPAVFTRESCASRNPS